MQTNNKLVFKFLVNEEERRHILPTMSNLEDNKF